MITVTLTDEENAALARAMLRVTKDDFFRWNYPPEDDDLLASVSQKFIDAIEGAENGPTQGPDEDRPAADGDGLASAGAASLPD